MILRIINTKLYGYISPVLFTILDQYSNEDIVNQIIPKLNCNNKFINNIISISNYKITKKKDDLADTLLYQIYAILYLI